MFVTSIININKAFWIKKHIDLAVKLSIHYYNYLLVFDYKESEKLLSH